MQSLTARLNVLSFVLLLLYNLWPHLQPHTAAAENVYIGAEQCAPCHQKIYNDWKTSGHAHILRKLSRKEAVDIPLPHGYTRKDISYLIGGYRWKALFLDRNGYLITSTKGGKGESQYNLVSKKWVDYLPGQRILYDCGRCHTTGYSPEGHQGGLSGIIGTWQFEGVQCEACHGPGALHARSSLKTDIKIDRNACSGCHALYPQNVIPVTSVFLAPYTEINQLLKSTMKHLTCVTCHNPHLPSKESIKQSCENCHQEVASIYRESYKHKRGITCIDCHMPPAGVVADGDAKTFDGDLKSHLFAINHAGVLAVVAKDGRRISPGYLSVDCACMRCHSVVENREWAMQYGLFSHRITISSNIKIMRFQMVFASIGFVFAVMAFLSAASLKKWFRPAQNMKQVLSIHKHAAWITFAAYVFVSAMCIYFHFPLSNPSKALNLGWFLVHPFNGVLGLIVYGGKILSVRKYKKGWAKPGMLWGIGLVVFWLIQYGTAVLAFFGILRV